MGVDDVLERAFGPLRAAVESGRIPGGVLGVVDADGSRSTRAIGQAQRVPTSRPMIRAELLADTNIFPTAEQMATFFTVGPVPQAAQRQRSRMWARFKAGQ